MSNFIKITDKLAVTSDEYQWIIKEYQGLRKRTNRDGTVTTEDKWDAVGYYPTLDMCVKQLGQYMLRKGSAKSVADLLRASNEISLLLGQKFTASAEITLKQQE